VTEVELITQVGAHLVASALVPSPGSIGINEPERADAFPAIVISLEDLHRRGNGIRHRTTLITDGALRWQATIDLSAPIVGDPPLVLLDKTRTGLILPHGGLVRRDATVGPLMKDDIAVTVDGVDRSLAIGVPLGDQFAVDPIVGKLMFARPLPPRGTLVAGYYLGQWEQRLERIGGTLRIDVLDPDARSVRALSESVLAAMLSPIASARILRLISLQSSAITSVGPPEPAFVSARRRTIRFAFEFEHAVDQPDSSGNIIDAIPIVASLAN
jgi:hypothetical protein